MHQQRHDQDIETAVRTARSTAVGESVRDPGRLGRLLYERWYVAGRATAGPSWVTQGRSWTASGPAATRTLLRLHLAVLPATALHVLGAVAARADDWDAPWLLTSSALFDDLPRPEGTVLRVPLACLGELRPEVDGLVEDLRPFLAADVPALTLRIGRGAALAQDPGDGRSFGEHRCGLVAAAVLASPRAHHREQVQRTLRGFAAAGIDPRAPYRSHGVGWDRPWRVA